MNVLARLWERRDFEALIPVVDALLESVIVRPDGRSEIRLRMSTPIQQILAVCEEVTEAAPTGVEPVFLP